jgi:hypothetical protein
MRVRGLGPCENRAPGLGLTRTGCHPLHHGCGHPEPAHLERGQDHGLTLVTAEPTAANRFECGDRNISYSRLTNNRACQLRIGRGAPARGVLPAQRWLCFLSEFRRSELLSRRPAAVILGGVQAGCLTARPLSSAAPDQRLWLPLSLPFVRARCPPTSSARVEPFDVPTVLNISEYRETNY